LGSKSFVKQSLTSEL